MPNCTAAGFTNCSTKNPNLRFHKNMTSGSRILRGKKSCSKNFYICSKYFEKLCFERDLKVNTMIVFYYAVTAAVIRCSLKVFCSSHLKYLKKALEVIVF